MAKLILKSTAGHFMVEQYETHKAHFYFYYIKEGSWSGKVLGRIHIRKTCINLDADVDIIEPLHYGDLSTLIKKLNDGCKEIQSELPDES